MDKDTPEPTDMQEITEENSTETETNKPTEKPENSCQWDKIQEDLVEVDGLAKLEYCYDTKANLIEERYYGADAKPKEQTEYDNPVARQVRRYKPNCPDFDSKECLERLEMYGKDNNLKEDSKGVAIYVQEWTENSFQLYFLNKEKKPTNHKGLGFAREVHSIQKTEKDGREEIQIEKNFFTIVKPKTGTPEEMAGKEELVPKFSEKTKTIEKKEFFENGIDIKHKSVFFNMNEMEEKKYIQERLKEAVRKEVQDDAEKKSKEEKIESIEHSKMLEYYQYLRTKDSKNVEYPQHKNKKLNPLEEEYIRAYRRLMPNGLKEKVEYYSPKILETYLVVSPFGELEEEKSFKFFPNTRGPQERRIVGLDLDRYGRPVKIEFLPENFSNLDLIKKEAPPAKEESTSKNK